MVKLPRLLDANFAEIARLHPSMLTANITLNALSTATMVLPEGEPPVVLGRWVELYDGGGKSLGIYRVTEVNMTLMGDREVVLEHGICTLGDMLTSAETTLSGSMGSILQALLDKQQDFTLWALGSVATTENYSIDTDREDALEAIFAAMKKANGYALTYDQSAVPWRLGVRKLGESPVCECRLSRNMESVTIDEDRRDLCTRAVSDALPDGHLDADTRNVWGTVEKELAGLADDAPQDKALAYAREYLAAHKNPATTITVSALVLAEQTGEPADRFALGDMCRVALAEYGNAQEKWITTMNYGDLVSAPDAVQLTLDSPARDLSSMIAELRSSSVKTARSSRRAGSAANKAMGYITEINGELRLQDERITLVAAKAKDNGNKISSAEIAIDGANAAIKLKADKTVVDEQGRRLSSAEIAIDGANAAIELKVSKDGVVSAINQSPEEITINAKRINLNGYVTATQLNAVKGDITDMTTGKLTFTILNGQQAKFYTLNVTSIGIKAGGLIYDGAGISVKSITVGGTTYKVLCSQ